MIETLARAAIATRGSRRANLVEELVTLPADTLDGCRAKARVLRAILGGECGPGAIEGLAESLTRDILAI